jgi:hypothetical protein
MAAAVLPPELLDLIFENLHAPQHYATISACCLVSRAWLKPGQRKLFTTLRLAKEDHCKLLVALFDSTPELASFAKRIIVIDLCNGNFKALTATPIDSVALTSVMNKCPNVDQLDVCKSIIDVRTRLHASASQIQSLALGPGVVVRKIKELFELLGQFPRLQDVSIFTLDPTWYPPSPPRPKGPNIHLKSLRVHNILNGPWPPAEPVASSWRLAVDKAELPLSGKTSVQILDGLLAQSAGSLRTLHLHLSPNLDNCKSSARPLLGRGALSLNRRS